jgi:hypothetical protein
VLEIVSCIRGLHCVLGGLDHMCGERSNLLSIYIYVCVREREFYYSVYNQCELFICLDLIVKNREVPIIYMYIYM